MSDQDATESSRTMPDHSNAETGTKLNCDLFSKRILLAEDDYYIAFDLRCELVRAGADVIGPVPDADLAADLIKAEVRIDAAVIDINLHGELAFPLVDDLIRQDIPVVFYTGYGPETVPYRLRHLPRLEKPVPPAVIVQTLAGMLAERKPALHD